MVSRTVTPAKSRNPGPKVFGRPPGPRFRGGDERSTSSRVFRVAGPKAFAEAGITHNHVDHLMIYDAPCSLPGANFAHLPIYGLEDLGFVRAARPAPSSPSATPPPAAGCR